MAKITPALNLTGQELTQWCWAAVVAAVGRHPPEGSSSSGTDESQCKVATRVLRAEGFVAGSVNCCSSPDPCNMPLQLSKALGSRCFDHATGHLSFADIQDEIDNHNRPVAVRIAWDHNRDGISFSAHFVLIVGCETRGGVQTLFVKDPSRARPNTVVPTDTVAYVKFRDHYRLDGVWAHTYLIT